MDVGATTDLAFFSLLTEGSRRVELPAVHGGARGVLLWDFHKDPGILEARGRCGVCEDQKGSEES